MKIIDLLNSEDFENKHLGIQLLKSHEKYNQIKNTYCLDWISPPSTIEDEINDFLNLYFQENSNDYLIQSYLRANCNSIVSALTRHQINI